MSVFVEKYWDHQTLEIKLGLPQGDSFIIAGKHSDALYDLSIFLPWYAGRHSVGAGICLEENLSEEEVLSYYQSPTYELIALIRKSLPVFDLFDREEDQEI